MFQKSSLEQEVEYYQQQIKTNSKDINAYTKLGKIFLNSNQIEPALNCYLKVDELAPNNPYIQNNLGVIFQKKKNYKSAINAYFKAIEGIKNNPFIYANLASSLELEDRFEESFYYFSLAHKLAPDNPNFYNGMGSSSAKLEKYDQALVYLNKALSMDNKNPNFYFNLALVHESLVNYQEAIKYYDIASKLNPNFMEAHFNMCILLLTLGYFERGWEEYEWRVYFIDNEYAYIFKDISWDGSDLKGEVLHVHSEQGLGDTLQFCRFLPLLKSKNGHISFKCHPQLADLMKSCEGYDSISVDETFLVEEGTLNVLLLSLPKIFKINLDTLPNKVPYLKADEKLVKKWQEKFSSIEGLKIGFAYEPKIDSTTHKTRSCPVKHFYNLLQHENITLFSLQKGTPIEKISDFPKNERFIDLADEINDFSDTAAIMENMDLIISIDTSVVHLAGALGQPTWNLLHSKPDWRWLLDRSDSPWYPTMKLFRQKIKGDWDSVFEEINKELKNSFL